MDDWNNMYFVRAIQEGNATFSLLFEKFYGAHTPALSRILLALEYFIFQGNNLFPKAVALVCVAGSMAIFYKNIPALGLETPQQLLLKITGLLLAFGAAQLYTFNYPWASIQHPPAILFSLLAIHFFTADIASNREITPSRTLLYLSLCTVSALFTAIGVFGMVIVFWGLIVYRIPLKSTLCYTTGLIILLYLLKPGLVILRTTPLVDAVLQMEETVILHKAGASGAPFFFGYSNHLFAYTGAILETISKTASIIIGGVFFSIFSIVSTITLFRRHKPWIFFQLTLYMLVAYAMVATWGRYETYDYQFDRYAAIYPWFIWSGCFLTSLVFRKTGGILCLLICVFSLATSAHYINKQLLIQRDATQADINMVNNSMVHMTYFKNATPLKLFGFEPAIFHDFQKKNQWGIYRHYAIPELQPINTKKCEAIKTKEFIVSEKKFVEYQLDSWNLTDHHYLPSVYALDAENHVIAQGASMPREPRWRPMALLPREDIMVYLVVPRAHPLSTLRLIGGSKGDWCNITLVKK